MEPKGPSTWEDVNTAIKEIPEESTPADYQKVAETIGGTPVPTESVPATQYTTPVTDAIAALPVEPTAEDYRKLSADLRATAPATTNGVQTETIRPTDQSQQKAGTPPEKPNMLTNRTIGDVIRDLFKR